MKLAVAAGETSGDRLAAALARELKSLEPRLELAGITGPAMESAGVLSLARVDELDMMGLTEILRHVPRLMRLRRSLRKDLARWPARAFVGVDSPDFNLGLARQLRRTGTFTAQLVAPSVWAWRRYRIAGIVRSLDLLMTLFPFEPGLFANSGLDARFVGHPLADELPREPDRSAARSELGLPPAGIVIGLLPGSRPGEIQRHAGIVTQTAGRLRRRWPEARLPVLLARPEHEALFKQALSAGSGKPELEFFVDRTRTGITAADAVLAASGTVTLEALLLKRPMVVFYRLAGSTYRLARLLRLVKSQYISLPNVLARRPLVPERIQAAASPDQLADDLAAWMDDAEAVRRFVEQARAIHEQLARGAAARAAETLLERLADD